MTPESLLASDSSRAASAWLSAYHHGGAGYTGRHLSKVAVIGAQSTAEADGIRDYSHRLVGALRDAARVDAALFCRPYSPFGTEFAPPDPSQAWELASADAIVVQYNPFWYGRRGFTPGLVAGLARLRRAMPDATVGLMVHENYIDAKNWKWALMGAWQRLQLRSLQRLAHVQFCSIEAWTDDLRRSVSRIPAHHLPVGSNFPDRREARSRSRRRFGLSDTDTALCVFGLHEPGRLHERVLAAARAARDRGHSVALLNLGAGRLADEEIVDGIRIISSGFLEAEAAAEALAAADVFLCALEDGASTRRGTLMAALQHEVAVAGTLGHLTDTLLCDSPQAISLTPVSEPERFVNAVVAIADSTSLRRRLARAGRTLYEQHFDWPVIAGRLLDGLETCR